MHIARTHHVALSTPDIARLRAFYVGTLGFATYRFRARRREKELFRRGHYSRFLVGIGPNVFTLKTSNPHLRNDFLTLNTPQR